MKPVKVRNKDLIKEVFILGKRSTNLTKHQIDFIMSRYFHYGIAGMMNGYKMISGNGINFSVGSVFVEDIPKRLRSGFEISQRIFGHVFMPVCESKLMTENGYVYKPNKKILSDMKDFSETDAIYKIVKA